MQRRTRVVALATALGIGFSGCALVPRATHEERLRAERAGAAWTRPSAERTLPDVEVTASWHALLRHALLANGSLEAAYHEWRAALARIDVAAAYPNTNLSLEYSYLFSDDNVKSWDRNSFTLGFDPMQNLSFPTKAIAAGHVALADAQAAGERFLAAKLTLQRDVLTAWYDFALAAEQLRLERERLALATTASEIALARTAASGDQATTLGSVMDGLRAEDRVRSLEVELVERRAALNALVGRDVEAPLVPPASLPEPRPLPSDDALFAAGVRNSPELAALARDHEARTHAVAAAKQEFIPDVNPFVGIEGGAAQLVGIAVSLPARVAVIRGQIAEARSMDARAAALEIQGGRDRWATFTGTLALLRDAERRTRLYRTEIVPLAERLVGSTRAAYEGGRLDLTTLVDAEQTVLEARAMLAESHVERERRLAALEAIGGFDAETVRES